ncbi:CD3072 family TudS-related putative desulfidase [Tissierella creatinophila]|uniref:DUF523 domain-containing protein n=1 Tax=Tissierella creatinophila DSM 6911 TaxID=1123403 RepID=A0A1U7M4Z2_TISCR|nr:CD3072 family TudS-related putative desulfidase [Tissierella creatinophila]OLS02383.1 hypothetical protein TICRE_17700 [Tissierella creatinophila DSM 6911]
MERSKRIIFIANCILNQNVVVSPLARAKGTYKDIIQTIMDYGIGIHQLPCPEFRHLGLGRKPMTKEEYDTHKYRELSREIGLDTVKIIREYLDHDYKIIGLIGINSSPSCGIYGETGITVEEIIKTMNEEDIHLNTIDVPVDYYDGEKGKEFIKNLKRFIEEKI